MVDFPAFISKIFGQLKVFEVKFFNFDMPLTFTRSFELPHKIWARAIKPFLSYLDTYKPADLTT